MISGEIEVNKFTGIYLIVKAKFGDDLLCYKEHGSKNKTKYIKYKNAGV